MKAGDAVAGAGWLLAMLMGVPPGVAIGASFAQQAMDDEDEDDQYDGREGTRA